MELDIKLMKRQVHGSRVRATRAGKLHTLTVDDVLLKWEQQQGRCALTGIPMSQADKTLYAVHLDQIVPGAGYTPDNIQLVCAGANTMKLAAKNGDVLKFIEDIRNAR